MRRAIVAVAMVVACAAWASETVWLDALDVSKVQQGWGTPHANQSVEGHGLSIAGRKFEHGLGTHSAGAMQVKLDGGSERFSAWVGIDDEVAGHPGSVEFEVAGDGKVLWRSGVMKTSDAAKQVDVDVRGIKVLLLLIGDAGDGYFFDHSDWADARFEVTGVKPVAETVTAEGGRAEIAMGADGSAPRINGAHTVGVRPGTEFLWKMAVTGDRPLKLSSDNVPQGLRCEASTGRMTGVIAKAGTYVVGLQAKNWRGVAKAKLTIVCGETIALMPAMGWNSYDAYGDSVTEAEVLANARYMAEHLQPHGWEYIVIDYRWYDPKDGGALVMDANGRLQPAPNRFPSGLKGVAAQVHAMGLKLGIHIMRGIARDAVKANLPIAGSPFKAADAANVNSPCSWSADMWGVDASKPAGQAWYDSVYRQFAEWGLDFVKVDDLSAPYSAGEIEAIRKAIDKCGRGIVFSTSPGETPRDQAENVAARANMWRTSGDFWDEWPMLSYSFDIAARWTGVGGPGHWPDLDMLPVGRLSVGNRCVGPDRGTRFTRAEQVALITLWAIAPSPLILGANLPDCDAWTTALLCNDEVLAINQDSLGASARRVAQSDGGEVWVKELEGGDKAVALVNRGWFEGKVAAEWKDVGAKGKWRVRDVWQRKDAGVFDGRYEATVPAHGAVMVRMSAVR